MFKVNNKNARNDVKGLYLFSEPKSYYFGTALQGLQSKYGQLLLLF